MKNKLNEIFKDKSIYYLCGAAMILALVYGFIKKPFYLNFINALSVLGIVYFAIGVFRWSWKSGDYTFFSYRLKHGSYSEWRKGRVNERKNATNPFLPASLIVIVVSLILTFFY